MPRPTYAAMSDKNLIAKLADMSRYNQKAAFVLAALTDDDWYQAVSELRRRAAVRGQAAFVAESRVSDTGRIRGASTVEIDPVRFKTYFANRRINLNTVGPMVGLCANWASTIASKRRASYWTLDRLATELCLPADEFVFAVATDRERQRVGLLT